ncbi:class I SAM-dependent methyltransferase [Nostoc sp. NMS9]|uniref:class I SAM-dependent methyltransferase n=1 Tax=Nostoc sp. NMS9 TaxID=2815393 RepID=UPI0025D64983|nr:class I SAM-dependent methyltransferase [Nostoc sp. NMS9]MBN3942259.1 methyltransferase domain-containing protein [Nostoc sp. NMS9]
MAQNIYDDQFFFEAYGQLPRSIHGLDGAPEWPALRRLLPPLQALSVLDLGCGFGWFSRWAAESGAESVLAVDLSERMLTRARAKTELTNVIFERADLETLVLPPAAFDLVYSSLVLHYVKRLPALLDTLFYATRSHGKLIFSVEHPLFTAPANATWETLPSGARVWPLDQYLIEGPRVTNWLAPSVTKQHRTISTYVNLLLAAGFHILAIEEWGPSPAQIEEHPEWASELHRPPFLLISAGREPKNAA